MKLRTIILSAATILGLAACQKPEDLGTPNVISSDNKLEFTQDGGTKTIQVNATVDWQLKDYTDEVKEWVVIDPSSGKASASDQTITIKVLPNDGKSRSAVITFYGNVLAKAAVTINQDGPLGTGVVPQGDGTLESPYSASQAHAEALKLASGASGSSYVYVKGFVKKVASVDTGSYGNANFYITDAADGAGDDFYCFQVMYLAGAKFTAADQIKFYKMLMNLGVGDNGVRVLKEETVKSILAVSTRPEGLGGYSLGLSAPVKDGEGEWFGHGGAWGTNCVVNWHTKELKLWVVQISGGPQPWNEDVAKAAERFFQSVVDMSEVNAYTGRIK